MSPVDLSDVCSLGGGPQSLASLGILPGPAFIPLTPVELEQTLGSRITSIAERQPERPAVCAREGALTYRQLVRKADAIAWAIERRLGPGKEPIALCFDHEGLTGPAAYVAALKTGRPYLSLDPDFPRERLIYVLRQSGAVGVFSDRTTLKAAASLAGETGLPVLDVESLDREALDEPFTDRAGLDDPIYINYTSGSTGRPKGIVWSQRRRMRSSLHAINNLQFTPDDRFSMLHSYGFSAVGPELWGALQSGACLLPFSVRRHGLAALGNWLRESEVTVFQWIPSALRALSASLPADVRFDSVRLLLLASEAATDREAAILRERFSSRCVLVNRYGCSETGLVSFYLVQSDTPVEPGRLPSGYPLPGREVYLTDSAGARVPTGEEGEIVVRTSAISDGYWREPELTTERFQEIAGSDERLFHTGDLGRFRPDGCLEYLGRADSQVKVRGHRVELAEVESRLRSIAEVADAVVIGQPDAGGEYRLIAYVVLKPGTSLTASRARTLLAGQLPEAFIPLRYLFLAALPRTATGKVDPSALPEPGIERPELDAPYEPPVSPLEEQLAAIWSDVLGVTPVGRDDPFTHLGGNSLRAGQVLSRISRQCGAELSLVDLLEAPTVARQAERVLETLLRNAGSATLEDLLLGHE